MTLQEIIEQLEACGYECEAGPLENNVAWQELKQKAQGNATPLYSDERIEKEFGSRNMFDKFSYSHQCLFVMRDEYERTR